MNASFFFFVTTSFFCGSQMIFLFLSFLKNLFSSKFDLFLRLSFSSSFISNEIYFGKINNKYVLHLAWFCLFSNSIQFNFSPFHSPIQFIGIFNCFLSHLMPPIFVHCISLTHNTAFYMRVHARQLARSHKIHSQIEFIFVFTAENCLAIRMCAFIHIIQQRIWNKVLLLVEHIPRMI